jgi:hypothetical protein
LSKPCTSLSLRNRLAAWAIAGLLAACGGGGGDSGGGGGGGAPGGGPITISGKAMYEFPPPAAGCLGLDFNALEQRPIRQAKIQVLDATTDAVLDAGVTSDAGDFALTVDANTQVYIRVRAELERTGGPAWNVEVRDNTVTESAAGDALPLENRPLYVLDTAPFGSGNVDLARDVTARTGWNNSTNRYTGTRAAAPFAVLDTAFAGMLLVLAEEPEAVFEPLDIFWSVNNRPSDGGAPGDIGTSFYSSGENHMFLLGAAGSDADEFDDHVVAHEWGHYFEDAFSRSDSIGGAHSLGDALDMRVAFGEGFATALSGIALEDPIYCDTTTSSGFDINIEEDGSGGTPGWFNETSVMELIYDLWDVAADTAGADDGSIGFGPIYRVMTGAQATTPAFTSIFSFATALKTENPLDEAFINQLLEAQDIEGEEITAFGGGETNDGSGGLIESTDVDVLPVYTTIIPDGSTKEICSNSQYDRDVSGLFATGNKLSEHRFLRMSIETPDRYLFEIRMTNTDDLPPDDPSNDRPQSDPDKSDPDILIQLNGVPQNQPVNGELQGFSGEANEEIFTTPDEMVPGEYVMALVEFRYLDEATVADYPARSCFDVTVTPAP